MVHDDGERRRDGAAGAMPRRASRAAMRRHASVPGAGRFKCCAKADCATRRSAPNAVRWCGATGACRNGRGFSSCAESLPVGSRRSTRMLGYVCGPIEVSRQSSARLEGPGSRPQAVAGCCATVLNGSPAVPACQSSPVGSAHHSAARVLVGHIFSQRELRQEIEHEKRAQKAVLRKENARREPFSRVAWVRSAAGSVAACQRGQHKHGAACRGRCWPRPPMVPHLAAVCAATWPTWQVLGRRRSSDAGAVL